MLLVILSVKKLLKYFANQKEFRVKKLSREKVINYMLNGKATIILSIVGMMKKAQYERVSIFVKQNLWGKM